MGTLTNFFFNFFSSSTPKIWKKCKASWKMHGRWKVIFSRTKLLEEEVFEALHGMGPTKVPSEDGMPALFYQQFWHVIGECQTLISFGDYRSLMFWFSLAELHCSTLVTAQNKMIIQCFDQECKRYQERGEKGSFPWVSWTLACLG